jgi:tetratricopeptide (TPR) repeat protein
MEDAFGAQLSKKSTRTFFRPGRDCAEVARSLRVQFTGAEQNRITRRPTGNSEAYRAYVKGRYFWNKRTTAGLWKGLKYFQQAVALDPTYTQALTGIADTYALLGEYAVLSPSVAFPVAEKYATKALEINPDMAEVSFGRQRRARELPAANAWQRWVRKEI